MIIILKGLISHFMNLKWQSIEIFSLPSIQLDYANVKFSEIFQSLNDENVNYIFLLNVR